MPAFDLPHLGKQLQIPHISSYSLPSNFTDAEDHDFFFFLFPEGDTYHLSNAAQPHSLGPPKMYFIYAVPPDDGKQKRPVNKLSSLHSAGSQLLSLMSLHAICSWNTLPQPSRTCLISQCSKLMYKGQMLKGQGKTYFNRLSPKITVSLET